MFELELVRAEIAIATRGPSRFVEPCFRRRRRSLVDTWAINRFVPMRSFVCPALCMPVCTPLRKTGAISLRR